VKEMAAACTGDGDGGIIMFILLVSQCSYAWIFDTCRAGFEPLNK
jgi:hypothetical protein